MKTITDFPFERRKENRIPFVVSVREYSQSGMVLCLSIDISSNGMAIKRAADSFPPDNTVLMEFAIPDSGEMIKIPVKFLRGQFNKDIQEGVVVFENTPDSFKRWFDSVRGRAASYIT